MPSLGRFASADTIVPDPTNPQSFNRFSYVRNNPLNLVDPSGYCDDSASDYADCLAQLQVIQSTYGITVEGDWQYSELLLLDSILWSIMDIFLNELTDQGSSAFFEAFSGTTLTRIKEDGTMFYLPSMTNIRVNAVAGFNNNVTIYNGTFQNLDGSARTFEEISGTIVHELGHIWDNNSGGQLSQGLKNEVSGQWSMTCFLFCWNYQVPLGSPAPGGNPSTPKEDWAYTFQALVVEPNRLASLNPTDNTRKNYVTQSVQNLRK